MSSILVRHPAPCALRLAPRSGFTLQEAMMTVIIVGILAAIAIPTYTKTIERGYFREAQDLLMAIYNGERSYYFTHHNVYQPVAQSATMAVWRAIYVDNPHLGAIPVSFSVSASGTGNAAIFTATATRSGQAVSINQDREWCGDPTCTTAASCASCSWQP